MLELFLILACFVGVAILLLPIIVAKRRRHRNYVSIVIMTFLFWPVAFVWSFTDNVER